MLGNILPPYHTLQELNLDWILTKVKDMLRFLPDDGSVGQILRRTSHGAEWSDEQGAGGSVTSVNGQQGAVVLTAVDVGALPDSTVIPDSTSDLINDSGFVDAAGAAAAAPVQSVAGKTGAVTLVKGDVGLGNVDNVQQYSASNPPPYPITSVNGQTGAVSLSIPSDTSDLNNDSGFVDAAGAAAAAPVQSVNGQTGAVSLAIPAVVNLNIGITSSGFTATIKSAKRYGAVVSISFDIKLTTALAPGATINFTITDWPKFTETYLRVNSVVSGTNQIGCFIGNPDLGGLSGVRNLSSTNFGINSEIFSFNVVYIEEP